MGLIELLNRYAELNDNVYTIEVFGDGMCRLWSRGVVVRAFKRAEEMRDYLIEKTKDSNTEDKVYL